MDMRELALWFFLVLAIVIFPFCWVYNFHTGTETAPFQDFLFVLFFLYLLGAFSLLLLKVENFLKSFAKIVDSIEKGSKHLAHLENMRSLTEESTKTQSKAFDETSILNVIRAIKSDIQQVTSEIKGVQRSAKRLWDLEEALAVWNRSGGPKNIWLWEQAQELKSLREELDKFVGAAPNEGILYKVARYVYRLNPLPIFDNADSEFDPDLVARLGGAVEALRRQLQRDFETRFGLRPMRIEEGKTPFDPVRHELMRENYVPTDKPEFDKKVARVYRHGFERIGGKEEVFRRACVSIYQLQGNSSRLNKTPDNWGDSEWDNLAEQVARVLQLEGKDRLQGISVFFGGSLNLGDFKFSVDGREWVSGERLAELPKTEGLRMVGVKWNGQLKVMPKR
jgi:uncharacterized protein YoxC